MRVKYEGKYGEFLGVTSTEHLDNVAVVRLEGHGLMLKLIHLSKLEPADKENK